LGLLSSKFAANSPVLTLHDAVFVAPKNLPTVERAFSTVLADLDFNMRWRVAA
jgi:hypothetical protein